MRIFFLFCYLVLFVIPFVFSTVRRHPHLSNASDSEALLGFMSAVTYQPSQSLLTTWKRNVSFCQWTGTTCSRRRQRVVSLNVSSMGLHGTISPHLANLSFLRILDLSNNSFQGHIPYQLGNLFRLQMLRLSLNKLEGSIPPTLGGCRSLRNFSMSHNNLIGKIPSELCVLPNLQYLGIAMNNLTGTIPACLGNISSLQHIILNDNHLHGSVPSELGMLSQVKFIYLWNNYLTGQIPSSFSNCTNLLVLCITNNQLIGHIPPDFCSKNNRLTELYLGLNQLSGSIPTSLSNCTKLQRLELGHNKLSGVVPMELGKLTQFHKITLTDNQLVSGSTTGLPILTALANCSTLQHIELSYNRLTGRLPSSIGLLSTKMDFISLANNELTGEIPPHVGNLTSLTLLALDGNYFTGAIPSSLIMLEKLERLYMGGNNLQANIPIAIGQLKKLGVLDLQKNNLSGKIPDSITHLQQLRYLYLNENQLSGNIPANIGKCENMLLLDLSYNKLSGYIPLDVAGLANLAFYFNLSNNLLHGPLPSELSKMTMLQAIDVSANQLTGHIPNSLGSCKELQYLNLSYNALEGLIPVSLDELLSLEDVDLSSNHLSGGIPMSLENLKMLYHLNFSFNKLSGKVPTGGVFKNLSATAFIGNLGLCGPWVGLSPCSPGEHHNVGHLKKVIIIVSAIMPIVVVLCLFLGILWRRCHKKHKLSSASLNVGHRRISYGELITATDEFSDANLLGIGSFGKVYKGVLNDGTIVSIKLLNVEDERAYKSFDKECMVLSKVRHRNLIRIITSYSDLQVKALIFPLMPNGNLEKWLYHNNEEQSDLSLIQRLNIAIDIAQGITYLHHHCFVQVIHCDLKPNNVLLGEDMTAYLIDFGIATICFANSEDSSFTSTRALKGSTGYIPPEYGLGGRVTTKGDVYSYGIMLLEMLTRKKPTDDMFAEGMNLQKWVGSAFPE
eukprot:PITA_29703